MSELQWVLDTEFAPTLHEITILVDECNSIITSATGKFILGGNDLKLNGLKAMVTMNSDEITEADISVECPNKQTYRTVIADGCSYRMQQLVNCCNALQAVRLSVQDAIEFGFASSEPRPTIASLGRIFELLKQARDHIVLPQKRTVEDLVRSTTRELFQPQLPNDICLSLYVSGQKLILAVYFLHHNQLAAPHPHAHEIAYRLNIQAVVPWLGKVLQCLSMAMLRTSQLIEKLNRICYTLG
ncbi:hypothetical protein BOX15_Mlig015038g1 [Macrostomum lignano]|uniref:Protein rogdi n=2 Tax=Macrostomum lignano TaxID=282301 RepID=A0A1I8J5Q2_9PLAT|nr:hypothetical protein BOX15_Mlig015038g1 [Macrostomum lignano]